MLGDCLARNGDFLRDHQGMDRKKIGRRPKQQVQAAQAGLLKKVKRYPVLEGKEIQVNSPDRDKMSQVLLDFAGPLLDRCRSEIPVYNIIGLAITAWNLSMLPQADQRRFLEGSPEKLSLGPEDLKEMNNVITWLMARKKQCRV